MERFFSGAVESSWPQIVGKVNSREHIDRDTWARIIAFTYAMRVRVPNTIKAVIQLLRESVCNASAELDAPAPELLVELFHKKHPEFRGQVAFNDLINSGIVNIDIDPHTAISSFEKLIQTNDSAFIFKEQPNFLHNMTDIDFVSSDNPVIFHIFRTNLDEITPYSFSSSDDNELIFPVSKKTALLLRTRNKKRRQHECTYSPNTVRKINDKISRYADRYVFGSSEESLRYLSDDLNLCPTPIFDRSMVGDGKVHKIAYEFGEPLKIRNKWKYSFEP